MHTFFDHCETRGALSLLYRWRAVCFLPSVLSLFLSPPLLSLSPLPSPLFFSNIYNYILLILYTIKTYDLPLYLSTIIYFNAWPIRMLMYFNRLLINNKKYLYILFLTSASNSLTSPTTWYVLFHLRARAHLTLPPSCISGYACNPKADKVLVFFFIDIKLLLLKIYQANLLSELLIFFTVWKLPTYQELLC